MAIRSFPVLSCWVLAAAAACSSGAHAQSILTHSAGTDVGPDAPGAVAVRADRLSPERRAGDFAERRGSAAACDATVLAGHGQPSPIGDGGTLSPWGHARSATLNNRGEAVLLVDIVGAARNQAIVVADADGMRAIAVGCGGAGGSGSTDGCGDPAPGGGSFSGFIGGNSAAPDINDNGDVLFLADPHDAGVRRALYLYQAQDDQIVRLAAMGDSVEGRTITAIGTGAMNNDGKVVFLAALDGDSQADILSWEAGDLSIYLKAGDPAPGGGHFLQFGTEFWGMADGSQLPGGPVPALNDVGQIAFRANVVGGQAAQGQFLSVDGEHQWLVQQGDPVPGGGTYAGVQAPLLNNTGQIAFYTDTAGGPGAAWVVGSPGNWRRALAWFDVYPEGTVWSLAYSRNPLAALADNGDLVLGTAFLQPDNAELNAVVLSRADGEGRVVALQGQPTPVGGSWNLLEAWPTLNGRHQLRIGATTVGVPGTGVNSQWLVDLCTDGVPAYESVPAVGELIDLGQVAIGDGAVQAPIDVGNRDASGSAPDNDLRLFHARSDHPAITVELLDRQPLSAGTAPDGDADLVIACSPTKPGVLTATVTVISNDPSQPTGGFAYPVTCEGVDDTLFRNGFEQP